MSGVRRCAENLKLMQDMKKKIHEVIGTGKSIFLLNKRHSVWEHRDGAC